MRRDNWGILAAALFGLIAFSAIGGFTLASSGYPQPERYPPYKDAANISSASNLAATLRNSARRQQKQPCQDPESREESDLCAQWVAANAARQKVIWTKRQFWIGLVTALGLGVTIILTLRAVVASERSLAHAKETAQIELRAYMTTESAHLVRRQEADTDEGISYRSKLTFKNYGSTPATDFRIRWNIFEQPTRPDFEELEGEAWDHVGAVAQGDTTYFEYDFKITKNALPLYSTGDMRTFLLCRWEYADVFGSRYNDEIVLRTDFDFEWAVPPNPREGESDQKDASQPSLI